MTTNSSESARSSRGWIGLLAIVLVGGAAVAWFTLRHYGMLGGRQEASPEDVERFYSGVAALDVEANERAVAAFEALTQSLPSEPAVWANLAVARLRVNESPAALEALAKAEQLAPDNPDIMMLQAVADERSGDFERAIERLKAIPNPDPAALYRLASLVERTGDETGARERLELINRILQQQPQNAVAQFQRARLAARLGDAQQLEQALQVLDQRRAEWNQLAVQQYEAAQKAATSGQLNEAAKFLTFLENVTKTLPSYQEALLALGATGGSVGIPIREFLKSPEPTIAVAKSDLRLTFEVQPAPGDAKRPEVFLAVVMSGEGNSTFVTVEGDQLRIGNDLTLPLPPGDAKRLAGRHSILAVDLNADLRQDLVHIGASGLAIFVQDEAGQFAPRTPKETEETVFQQPGHGVWALDFEADGDLDLLTANDDGSSQVIRNNGDMTFTPVDTLADLPVPRELLWFDLDNDGDVDLAVLDSSGTVSIVWNQRSGQFGKPTTLGFTVPAMAMAVGDLNLDGTLDLAVLDQAATIHQFSYERARDAWSRTHLATWTGAPDIGKAFESGQASLWLADLDNNGAIDLAASAGTNTAIWLNDAATTLHRLERAPSLFVTSVADVDRNGHLDLVGLSTEGAQVATGQGTMGYHWQVLLPRTNLNAADQRFNSFGVGGRIEVRAGKLLQVAAIDGPRIHFGLGPHQQVAVARIVWPNGTFQAEFDLKADGAITAQQRLKGSCPFVFVRGEQGFEFVKDFIWRSPLGLKINSQDTAGVNQTRDWIRIPGELVSPQNGLYEVRITAELWETHFFDHISFMVVDHPSEVEAHVDERFVASRDPLLEVTAIRPLQPLQRVLDESGQDTTDKVRANDGEYVDSFKLGRFQGLAEEHWVEFELDATVPTQEQVYLVGSGWIYPTDSSLNVAISQGNSSPPHGLILEVPDGDGNWRAVSDDLGFPAGKNKTVLIPLPRELLKSGQRQFRLRTNLEVYWDSLAWSVAAPEADITTNRVVTRVSELRYRGFSELSPLDRRKPDIPRYDRLSAYGQRWRDLEGYYTRFGDVSELLEATDDRYVIMNAGDEIVLQFAEPDPPPEGWKRDFVLIGDGWVKDGDYNTTYSGTVHPLPTHADSDYSASGPSLFDDHTFQKHRDDWRRFHTRYVSPNHFERGLWPVSTLQNDHEID